MATVCLTAAFVSAGVLTASQDRRPASDGCEVDAVYQAAVSSKAWIDTAGRPTHLAFDALTLLERAADDGLETADYRARVLLNEATALSTGAPPSPSAVAAFEFSLSHSLVHFVLDLHRGRIDPRAAGYALPRRNGSEAIDALRRAIERKQVSTITHEVAPQFEAYTSLRAQLQLFREKAVPAARLDDAATKPAAAFETRVRQIELSLERLRWLPALPQGPIVAINIPAFRLWAWNGGAPGERPALSMRVIVGRASNGRTPVFAGTIESVVIRPYWNVPRSIARGEILPRLAQDPAYLARQDLEIVSIAGNATMPATAEAIALVRDGGAMIRQRPGANNALGLVKLVFPNKWDVYIHGTPTPQLFNRERRDLSHGCIRAEDPVAIAAWLLAGGDWTRDRIAAATEGSETITVDLPRRVPVAVFYTTAFVSPDDGLLSFVPDIYGHDARLYKLLKARRPDLVNVR